MTPYPATKWRERRDAALERASSSKRPPVRAFWRFRASHYTRELQLAELQHLKAERDAPFARASHR